MTTKTTTASTPAKHICPVHLIRLTYVLAGGAGHCARCGLFVQSLNHPLPTLAPELVIKRAQALALARKERRRAAARKAKQARQVKAASAGACTPAEVKR